MQTSVPEKVLHVIPEPSSSLSSCAFQPHSAAVSRQEHSSSYPLHRYSHGKEIGVHGPDRNRHIDLDGMLQCISAEQFINSLSTDTEICCVCRNSGP